MTELDRLLERVTFEPAFGPAFYDALLRGPVYALIPAGAVFTPAGTVRFIMWTGADGQRIIPFFSNRAAARRALTKETQALRLTGRTFLEACQGAIVVLNPNERFFCRLTPREVALLLATGSPSAPENYTPSQDMEMALQSPEAPAEFLNSLALLFSQHPDVDRAFLVTLHAKDSSLPEVWLVAVLVESDETAERVSRQMSALLTDMLPPRSVDLLRLKSGEANALAIEAHVPPFYDRAFGAKVVMDARSSVQ